MAVDKKIAQIDEELGKLHAREGELQGNIKDTDQRIHQLQEPTGPVSDPYAEELKGTLATLKGVYETELGRVHGEIAVQNLERNAAVHDKEISELGTMDAGHEVKEQFGREQEIAGEVEKRAAAAQVHEGIGTAVNEALGRVGSPQDVSAQTFDAPASLNLQEPPVCDPEHPAGQTQTMVHSDGSYLSNPSHLQDFPTDPLTNTAMLLTVTGVYAGQKFVEMGQDLKDQYFTVPEVELHDLTKEQDAQAKLMRSESFEAMSLDDKANELNKFYAGQDKLRDASYDKLHEQANTLLREAHGNVPSAELTEQQMRLDQEVLKMREDAHELAHASRCETVQAMCKDDATKAVEMEHANQIKQYDKRLEDLNKEAPEALRQNYVDSLSLAAPQQIEDRTTDLQEKHFPDFPPPEISGPGNDGPGNGGPGNDGPGGGR